MATCWIIAGPNGAGKTTFALNYLPRAAQCHCFINADLIAAGLNPLAPARGLLHASRLFLTELRSSVLGRYDFGFETTLSGRGHLRLIHQLVSGRWRVELIYLALPNLDLSRQRVAERVAHGGHDIAEKDLVRRFPRSLNNLINIYSKAASRTRCFMNETERPILVFEQTSDQRTIIHPEYFNLLKQESSL